MSVLGAYYSIEQLKEIILKDKDYYETSKGGVTFSGGEAVNQISFLSKLGAELKKAGLHICVDISGFGTMNQFEKTLAFTDLYLLDYKITQKEDYQKLLSQKFDITPLLKLFQTNKKDVILCCPIIPEINDKEEHLQAIAQFSQKYSCIKYTDILPYHNLTKNNRFNYAHAPKKYRVPNDRDKQLWINWLKKYYACEIFMENVKYM